MDDITQLLVRARDGESDCLSDVFAMLYPELLRMARGRLSGPEATLTPTVLVHEAYLRLTGGSELSLQDRRHFFACAARAMRSIIVDAARRRTAKKRGGKERDITLTDRLAPSADRDAEVMSLDQVLDEMRERRSRQVEVVELHYFAGFGFAEIGQLLACSERTVKREWERARAFLHARLAAEP
jgi:RNA polymerase sigma factor (TIGR02999 family)